MPAPKFQVQVPVDASGIQGIRPDQKVRVVAQDAAGNLQSAVVQLDAKGQGTAALGFEGNPGRLRIALGPVTAEAEDILGLQTVETRVPGRALTPGRVFKLPPLKVPLIFWEQWWKLCRKFTVTGRVLCPSGRPVPGAKVCAYDVDFWWWWGSRQLVGCDTTDENGRFEIKFKWCCGFLPWWWWSRRVWQLEPALVEHIYPLLRALPRPVRAIPQPRPDLSIFRELLGGDPAPAAAAPTAATAAIDPAALAGLRDQLVRERRLPAAPVIEKWKLWPWFPWQPWFDCSPDLIFRVTQSCHAEETVIVDEGIDAVRWNVPTALDVTLGANDQACCLAPDDDDPEGMCARLTNVCGLPVGQIGGNSGNTGPAGYYVGPGGQEDRPFAGSVRIAGQMGDEVDYYEFEWSDDGGATWQDLPPETAGGFTRELWIPPTTTIPVTFNFDTLDGRLVMETRKHYEATHPGPHPWTETEYFALMYWRTENRIPDGTHRLRVKGYKRVGDQLQNETILPTCTIQDPAGLVLRIDNRANVHPPSTTDHPCGEGTVHLCVVEPDTDFLSVKINGVAVGACDLVNAQAGGTLEIEFLAHDPDRHLSQYTLQATFGENGVVDLLNDVPGAVLTSGPGVQRGPTYAAALGQGATAPFWEGGVIKLTIPDLKKAFKITCCYQLELWAYKRTIVSCYTGSGHWNLSQFSFMVVV